MLTSARNTLYGVVDAVVAGMVNSEIDLSVGGEKIAAVVTNESVNRLGLQKGMSVYALIKSNSVILAKTKPGKISARNVLMAKVTEVINGAVNAEVKMSFGDSALTAVITNDSCNELMIKKDDTVYAIFKASSVIIGIAE